MLARKLFAFTLFTAIMCTIGWVMKQIAPPISRTLIATFGPTVTLTLVAAVILAAGSYGYIASRPRS